MGSLAVGLSVHLEAIEEGLRSGKFQEALQWMKRTRKVFDESMGRLKAVAVQLRPPELDVLGLRAALRQHFSHVAKQGDIRIQFRENLRRRRLSENTATVLFRIAQEALTNAITHGHATRLDVSLRASKKEVSLAVRNNGKEFNPLTGQRCLAPSRIAPLSFANPNPRHNWHLSDEVRHAEDDAFDLCPKPCRIPGPVTLSHSRTSTVTFV